MAAMGLFGLILERLIFRHTLTDHMTGLTVSLGIIMVVENLAAALFTPLRSRVQHLVDRRFNRTRYDADQTLTAFAARLKDAVDQDAVRADLLGVVHRSLEPTHAAVWVRLVR